MSFNLIRNARMFFTSNVDVNTGVVKTNGFTASNTKEIQVLDGLSFSQATGSETVTINEAGTSPIRGQRSFNTSLEPVELSFSTYMRPFFNEGTGTVGATYDADDVVDAEEDVLWNAFAAGYVNGTDELIAASSRTTATAGTAPSAGTMGASAAWFQVNGTGDVEPYSKLIFENSGKNQMVKFGVIILMDSTSYVIDNCVLDQASIDFGLDAIATIAWTARGSALRSVDLSATTTPVAGTVTFSGNFLTGDSPASAVTRTNVSINDATDVFTYASHGLRKGMQVTVAAPGAGALPTGLTAGTYYVIEVLTANTFKLSATLNGTSIDATTAGGACNITFNEDTTADVAKAKVTTAPFLANKLSAVTVQDGIGGTGTSYTLALTGGNITFSNNVTYLTPANLGTVNKPFTYFTGTRAVSGSINCYLRTGTNRSAQLLSDMLVGSASDVEPDFKIVLSIGGANTAGTNRILVTLPACVLTIPAINTEQVVSSTINFTAQGSSNSAFAIDQNNEATVTYYAAKT